MTRHCMPCIKQILSVEQLSLEMIVALINRALDYKKGKSYQFLEPKYVANVFLNDNFSQCCSMKMAQQRLGIKSIDASMLSQDVSLSEAILTLEALDVDAMIVSTSNKNGSFDNFVQQAHSYRIINIGDEKGESPIRVLSELMSIYEKFNCFEALKVVVLYDDMQKCSKNNICKALEKLGCDIFFLKVGEFLENYPTEMDVIIDCCSQKTTQKENKLMDVVFESSDIDGRTVVILNDSFCCNKVDVSSAYTERLKNSMYINMAVLESMLD